MPIAAAAGYPQYSDFLQTPVFSDRIISDFWDQTVFKEITTTDYLNEVVKYGETVYFNRSPAVRVRTHIKNQAIEHDTFEMDRFKVSIDKAFDYSIKISCIDVQQIKSWKTIMNEIRKAGSASMAKTTDQCILNEVYMQVHACNQGANAGIISHCYDMGSTGAPVQLTSDTILEFFTHVSAVLDEQNCPPLNRWGVLPGEAMPMLAKALGDVSFFGLAMSPLLNGKIPNAIYGFQMHKSHCVRWVIDPITGDRCYHLIFGNKDAIALAVQMQKVRTIDDDKDSWDLYFQALQVWGFGVIRPECLVHAYVTFVKP